ncbi:MAG TPA: type II toxin-antitoxin system VapC family toxin [Myxococcales bacterium]
MIVADASAVVDLLLGGDAAAPIAARLLDPAETVHVPHLLDVEVAQVLRRYALSGELDAARGEQAISDLADFPFRRYPHASLLDRAWEFRHSLPAYEAVYVALAEALDTTLVTRDRRLARTKANSARIEVI